MKKYILLSVIIGIYIGALLFVHDAHVNIVIGLLLGMAFRDCMKELEGEDK